MQNKNLHGFRSMAEELEFIERFNKAVKKLKESGRDLNIPITTIKENGDYEDTKCD